jgi:DNA-binding MarR family transcriptional regulator
MNKSQIAPIIIGKLLNINGMLQRHGNKILMPYGLNQQQFSILFEILKVEKVKQKEMVNRLSLEKAHVSKVVKKLYKMELIDIKTSDEDKRSSWLIPTTKGEQLLSECMQKFEEWNNDWLEDFEDKQLDSIIHNLIYLQTVFKNKIQEKE